MILRAESVPFIPTSSLQYGCCSSAVPGNQFSTLNLLVTVFPGWIVIPAVPLPFLYDPLVMARALLFQMAFAIARQLSPGKVYQSIRTLGESTEASNASLMLANGPLYGSVFIVSVSVISVCNHTVSDSTCKKDHDLNVVTNLSTLEGNTSTRVSVFRNFLFRLEVITGL